MASLKEARDLRKQLKQVKEKKRIDKLIKYKEQEQEKKEKKELIGYNSKERRKCRKQLQGVKEHMDRIKSSNTAPKKSIYQLLTCRCSNKYKGVTVDFKRTRRWTTEGFVYY